MKDVNSSAFTRIPVPGTFFCDYFNNLKKRSMSSKCFFQWSVFLSTYRRTTVRKIRNFRCSLDNNINFVGLKYRLKSLNRRGPTTNVGEDTFNLKPADKLSPRVCVFDIYRCSHVIQRVLDSNVYCPGNVRRILKTDVRGFQ